MSRVYKNARTFYFDAVSTFASHRGLRPLLVAEAISSSGTSVLTLAVPWLVLERGGSGGQVSAVLVAEALPVALLGLPAAALVARVGARRFMLTADASRAVLVGLIPALSALGLLPFWALLLVVFATGAFNAPYTGSQQDLLSGVIGTDEAALAAATSILQTVTRTTLLLGPPLAGVLVAAFGPAPVIWITTLTYLLVFLTVLVSVPAQPRPAAGQPVRVADGIRALRTSRLVANWTLGSVFSEAAFQALFVAVPLLVLYRYHGTAEDSGILLGCFGGGAVAGSLLAAALSRRTSGVRLAMTGKLTQCAVYALLIATLPVTGAAAVMAALGIGNGLANGPSMALRIRAIDPPLRGPALTVASAINITGGMAGLAIAGPIIDTAGATTLFLGTTALQLLSLLLFIRGVRFAPTSHHIPSETATTPTPLD